MRKYVAGGDVCEFGPFQGVWHCVVNGQPYEVPLYEVETCSVVVAWHPRWNTPKCNQVFAGRQDGSERTIDLPSLDVALEVYADLRQNRWLYRSDRRRREQQQNQGMGA